MKIKILLALLVTSFVCFADQNLSTKYSISVDQSICQGRLTLTSGTPVTTSDVTAATTLYFTPYNGNKIAVYDGSSVWSVRSFSELSLSISSLTASTNYDIFIYNNSGTLTLSATAWTNATTRATALYNQNGIYVKTGATNYRYMGTIRITSTTGQCEDSVTKRFVWNMYNRVERRLKRFESTATWPYSTATWRQANNSASNQVECVFGLAGDPVKLKIWSAVTSNGTNGAGASSVAIGVDSTSTESADNLGMRGATSFTNLFGVTAQYEAPSLLGYHYYAWLEKGFGSDTQTWYGYSANLWNSGILGNSLF